MQAAETLRSSDVRSIPQATSAQPADARALQTQREATIYRLVIGTWMVLLIGFGLLQLMGAIRV
jgi:hypothetical protein